MMSGNVLAGGEVFDTPPTGGVVETSLSLKSNMLFSADQGEDLVISISYEHWFTATAPYDIMAPDGRGGGLATPDWSITTWEQDVGPEQWDFDEGYADRTNSVNKHEHSGQWVITVEEGTTERLTVQASAGGKAIAHSAPVPEPTTIALLGIGLVGLAGAEVRRRRKKKAVDNS